MNLFVALAVFEDCPATWLNSLRASAALEAAIVAGSFTRYSVTVQPFEPQGVTACAIVGESHLTLHSWPEEGRLFVDVASCSTLESVRRAIDAIGLAMPAGRLTILDERVIDRSGARAAARAAAGLAAPGAVTRVDSLSSGTRGEPAVAAAPEQSEG